MDIDLIGHFRRQDRWKASIRDLSVEQAELAHTARALIAAQPDIHHWMRQAATTSEQINLLQDTAALFAHDPHMEAMCRQAIVSADRTAAKALSVIAASHELVDAVMNHVHLLSMIADAAMEAKGKDIDDLAAQAKRAKQKPVKVKLPKPEKPAKPPKPPKQPKPEPIRKTNPAPPAKRILGRLEGKLRIVAKQSSRWMCTQRIHRWQSVRRTWDYAVDVEPESVDVVE